jgi:hypothetical protein
MKDYSNANSKPDSASRMGGAALALLLGVVIGLMVGVPAAMFGALGDDGIAATVVGTALLTGLAGSVFPFAAIEAGLGLSHFVAGAIKSILFFEFCFDDINREVTPGYGAGNVLRWIFAAGMVAGGIAFMLPRFV